MDLKIKELDDNIEKFKKRLKPLDQIYKRYVNARIISSYQSQYEEVQRRLNDMEERVGFLKKGVFNLKNLFHLTVTFKKDLIFYNEDFDKALISLDEHFDKFYHLYMEMEVKIKSEKQEQERIMDDIFHQFTDFAEYEIVDDEDSLAVVLWKDWIETIKWIDFKERVFSKGFDRKI